MCAWPRVALCVTLARKLEKGKRDHRISRYLTQGAQEIMCEVDVGGTDASSEDALQLWLTAEQARWWDRA